jgi:hypothetical protein
VQNSYLPCEKRKKIIGELSNIYLKSTSADILFKKYLAGGMQNTPSARCSYTVQCRRELVSNSDIMFSM